MDLNDSHAVGNADSNLSKGLEDMPDEILEIIRLQQTPQFLQALAIAALKPHLTLKLFTIYDNVFTETCARWTTIGKEMCQKNQVVEGFARILPLAPYLSQFLEEYLEISTSRAGHERQEARILTLHEDGQDLERVSTLDLQRMLLATFRLLNFDKFTFSRKVSGAEVQSLLQHSDGCVRYLAVRIFCQLYSASDLKLEHMLEKHIGKDEAPMGDYDGTMVDFGFLSLFEVKRLENGHDRRGASQAMPLNMTGASRTILQCEKLLYPRLNGEPKTKSHYIQTSTTSENKARFVQGLLTSSPLLLHGLAGSGKTSLVNDYARELGKDSLMVTLHLNEQTDAKMLIGMYASGSAPGSFTWRAGVLTTAVREGRWVFIEDLDRAPIEVISVILPLIERGELLIPSRSETIKAGRGFRLFASIRTSLSVTGHENPPSPHMLGSRLWHRVPIQMPSMVEFQEILTQTYPILENSLSDMMSMFTAVYENSRRPAFASKSRTSLGRPVSPRDLFKWCRRLCPIYKAAQEAKGKSFFDDGVRESIFLEAVDCFAGSLQTDEARKELVDVIAERMRIDSQLEEQIITGRIPKYDEGDQEIRIGRVRLRRRPASRVTKSTKKSRPFANTTHAKRLLEKVAAAVKMSEPVLLVGETGIGKTTVIQQLATSLGYKLTAVNLSQQSEVGDLLGGFKPVNIRSLATPLKDEFDDLFSSTGISTVKNQKYLDQLGRAVAKSHWKRASKLWREAPKMFARIIFELKNKEKPSTRPIDEQPMKRRKTESRLQSLMNLMPRWEKFSQSLDQFDIQLSGGSTGFAFTFVEGNIVKAARNGDWVLLDEINLASPDTLESIADLLHSGIEGVPSILLSETGEIERVQAHPHFRIFGAMNPATDVGKRDLPISLRSRFTEIYVDSPDRILDDLLGVISAYLDNSSSKDERAAHDVARLYLNTKRLADEKRLVDGANQVPHFSLRTLTRVLSYVNEISPLYGLRRALFEGFAMGFLTLLNRESEKMLMPLIDHYLLGSHKNITALLSQTPKYPNDGREYVPFVNKKRNRHYWMLKGFEPPMVQPHYIITDSVERNMLNLVRATSTRRFPVLVQGPTSSGKTSMIEYLAKHSGNRFIRINNHEHTDLQEYLGTYISGTDGQLRFQEGLLVQALRQGHWIVLDELNLAPTDVLEALNRLLDDNRELLIPETQELVRPHENFMLFATQNPPGLYGGRKTLSRAFRNRFLELHFDDIPETELETILQQRSQKLAPSDCARIVKIYQELSKLRQSNRLFEQKESFATLRDLFRWALRDAENREDIAANGYMLLAERVRNPEERIAVKEIIEKVMKVKIDPTTLYGAHLSAEINSYDLTSNSQEIVWTQAIRRVYVLVAHALRNNEPVLLVGETGCGKTTVCQMLAEASAKDLHIVNAHQNTESGDIIGAQRPVRNRAVVLGQLRQDLQLLLRFLTLKITETGKNEAILGSLNLDSTEADDTDALSRLLALLPESIMEQAPKDLLIRIEGNQTKAKALFEWSDGSLVHAMRDGQYFLLDEISLADDSVLERLNSVLETQRSILLAEKGVENSFVTAKDGFQFLATMNPGGDYGKRELSPALRNRFTEIWVPSLSEHEDVFQIVEAKLVPKYRPFSKAMVQFAEWFGQNYRSSSSTSISVRDILAWIKFMNGCDVSDPYFAVLHGAAMVFIDTLGANPAALLAISSDRIIEERAKCLNKLGNLLKHNVNRLYFKSVDLINEDYQLKIGEFSIAKKHGSDADPGFAFEAPTTKLNAMRVIRALQLQKPILIEGSPGVGKTTLINALARACNHPLTRINLSEQTDLMDLFGSDVPVEGAAAGSFAWRDAPFLKAMQRGEWVLLDEMNLASQSVLEGLNACLDHRGEVYISELDQTFRRHPNFFVFAAQNPHHQGGGRKGLPSSFVNRFTVVYADVFKNEDLQLISKHNFPLMSDETINIIISFVATLEQETVHEQRFGSQGGPWEFNLRDILRWFRLLSSSAPLLTVSQPSDFLNLIFRQRFRTTKDRQEVDKIYARVFDHEVPFRHFFHNMSSSANQVGLAYTARDALTQPLPFPKINPINRLPEIESVMMCIQQRLPCILVGPSGSGKTTLLQHIAAFTGKSLVTFSLNADIDTMDLVGGFEQVDPQRAAGAFLEGLQSFLRDKVLSALPAQCPREAISLLELLNSGRPLTSLHFSELARILLSLAARTSLPEFGELAVTCQNFAEIPITVENARFEWVDGVLIKALEQGQWLVLDNANLCSASVLDRLNSLLEPNGYLSINEHCGPDGEPKIVKPHPDFRIFLTMDARFGELSRAMRNRAIEIFLQPIQFDDKFLHSILTPKPEATMQRYHNLQKVISLKNGDAKTAKVLFATAMDNLTRADTPLLKRFVASFSSESSEQEQLLKTYAVYSDVHGSSSSEKMRKEYGMLLDTFAKKTNSVQAAFKDAQILHPLQNSPLVPLLVQIQGTENLFWLGTIFELTHELTVMSQVTTDQQDQVNVLKPSQMNRYQRSSVVDRVPAVGKDSTANVSRFLQTVWEALNLYVRMHEETGTHWRVRRRELVCLIQFWWDTYHLVTASSFEESTFQAHLIIGEKLTARIDLPLTLSLSSQEPSPAQRIRESLAVDFSRGFKLTTGLSMEVMWKKLRPQPITSATAMSTLKQMEHLSSRYDNLRWKISTPASELGNTVASFLKAYQLLRSPGVDCASLVTSLEKEMETLEKSIGRSEDMVIPYFAHNFEALRQLEVITSMSSPPRSNLLLNTNIGVLANSPTNANLQLSTSTVSSWPLQVIDYLWGAGDRLLPLSESPSASLLKKIRGIGDVNLRSLKMLESELPIIAQSLAIHSDMICQDQALTLNDALPRLILSIASSHEGTIKADLEAIYREVQQRSEVKSQSLSRSAETATEYWNSPFSVSQSLCHLPDIFNTHFTSSLFSVVASKQEQEHRLQFSALAWIHFSIGCIKLYVPDRAFDPDKRQKLERQHHLTRSADLHQKLAALTTFEKLFSGQESNLRCQLLQQDITELGNPPQVLQGIYRPKVSEMTELQGEFNNLLKAVLGPDLVKMVVEYFHAGSETQLQQMRLAQNNIDQVIRRLSGRFGAYNDLTTPVISMLRCLQIGLSTATLVSFDASAENGLLQGLSSMTPFLGGGPSAVKENFISHQPMEYLAFMATTVSIEGLAALNTSSRQALLQAFHECYDQWTKKLEVDCLEAESNSGLYRFRGSAEDEEEDDQKEFNELFPAYDQEASDETREKLEQHTTRDIAVELAVVHSNIFLGSSRTQDESIKSLTRHVSNKIGSLHERIIPLNVSTVTKQLLPGVILLLHDQMQALGPEGALSSSYNFYTDPNLPKTRDLVALVHQIQSRFRELQAVDEIGHMQPLEDVLVSCRELLQFRYTEPLAKIITKVEKVHTYMHEWQFGGWASRANSALTHYDNLTATIVSWRRLELSTWAKLFDMETKTCEDDARSWWFIAYQVVIAAPLQMSESPAELKVYVHKLLKDLEAYFSTAIIGQYVQRLQLLKQLQKHLELVVVDIPSMSIIYVGLTIFINLYQRYEKPVLENLKKSRTSLEKLMRDVLLLASWKDTNIVALRDSAKRSHHKLFKIVRKFRALLGQPMKVVLDQGLPDETNVDALEFTLPKFLAPVLDSAALKFCTASVPNWSQKSKRFTNVTKTVNLMADASQLPPTAIDAAGYLETFIADIISSTVELQKTTPTVLSDENKSLVKYLKSRKRKLFANTLKELRRAGIKYNLGADALAKQNELSAVLATIDVLPNTSIAGLEYYLHKSIDMVPRARAATRQHSEDLSSAEVARSMGFLEGLLLTVVEQRNILSTSSNGLLKLRSNLQMMKALWAPERYGIRGKASESSHLKVLRWLPSIFTVAQDIVQTHAKLGGVDSQSIISALLLYCDQFRELNRAWDNLSILPVEVVSTEQISLELTINDAVDKIHGELVELCENRLDLSFVLDQILPWLSLLVSPIPPTSQNSSLTDLDSKLSTLLDSILVAVEKHKQSIQNLPTSSEDPSWLVNVGSCLAVSHRALHCDNIVSQIELAFAILRSLDLDDIIGKVAGALFAVAIPIVEQYFNILEQSVNRLAHLHRATCKTTYILSKSFIQIATHGFCTPSEKSDAQDGRSDKLEGGTGLGDGEGAEDISKDIQDDENLDELAQELDSGDKNDIEDQEDAVDMADGDLEGEMGDAEGKGDDNEDSGGEEDDKTMDEEAGDVDDLDPTAVDEKLWDGDGEQAEKDQEGDDSKGKQDNKDQAAAQENTKEGAENEEGDEGDEEEIAGAELGEEIKQDDVEKHDSHAQEGEALDLPEDMELDGNEEEGSEPGSDDGMEDLSDAENDPREGDDVVTDGKEDSDAEAMDGEENEEFGDEMDVIDVDEDKDDDGNDMEEAGKPADDIPEQGELEDQEGLLQNNNDDANADTENAAPSDAQGVGDDQDQNSDDKTDSNSKAQRDDGGNGGDSTEQKEAAAEDGEKGRQANGDAPQDARDETQDSTAAQPFKKLGDALESWHRQQTQIRDAPEQKEPGQDQTTDQNAEASEFQHLQDQSAEADNQALGNATEEQAHHLDESMVIDTDSKDMPAQFQSDEAEDDNINYDDVVGPDEQASSKEQDSSDAYEGRAGAMIKQANADQITSLEEAQAHIEQDLAEQVEEVDDQLEHTHLENKQFSLRSAVNARQQWIHYESKTRDLSLSLTEQLRLILAPTLAIKMRGDFRTGKRLNIKRIIPYIASQYKRDKIWMRRSIPSKRSYQIMLALDDSKSMGESGSGSLAFETLVMVSKSLSMLEVGEICVVGFGEDVKVAHDFDTPFSSDAGPRALQHFNFKQNRTDVVKLVKDSIDLFRTARQKASSSPADLWQMELIVSDGVCESRDHDIIRRLLREALEDRIMIVFVIVDDVNNKMGGQSVLDLNQATFVDGKVITSRYLDSFPFQYYIVVSDVKELPGVLATLLRQWFAEVVDYSS